jgi:hypothetical protein
MPTAWHAKYMAPATAHPQGHSDVLWCSNCDKLPTICAQRQPAGNLLAQTPSHVTNGVHALLMLRFCSANLGDVFIAVGCDRRGILVVPERHSHSPTHTHAQAHQQRHRSNFPPATQRREARGLQGACIPSAASRKTLSMGYHSARRTGERTLTANGARHRIQPLSP